MRRPLVRYGSDGLTSAARPVTVIDDAVRQLATDMVETMHGAPGVGLAAPQVGIPLRVAVIDLSVGRHSQELITLINPEIALREGLQVEDEGCLSLPGFTASVARPRHMVVRSLDIDGRPRTIEGTGLLARALQHELDHLNGVLFLDRIRPLRRRFIVGRIEALQHAGRW